MCAHNLGLGVVGHDVTGAKRSWAGGQWGRRLWGTTLWGTLSLGLKPKSLGPDVLWQDDGNHLDNIPCGNRMMKTYHIIPMPPNNKRCIECLTWRLTPFSENVDLLDMVKLNPC